VGRVPTEHETEHETNHGYACDADGSGLVPTCKRVWKQYNEVSEGMSEGVSDAGGLLTKIRSTHFLHTFATLRLSGVHNPPDSRLPVHNTIFSNPTHADLYPTRRVSTGTSA